LGFPVLVCFTIGIIAAAFSSADSALTALTTSFCVDILDNSKLPKEQAERQRKKVHFYISVVFILCILIFRLLNNKSVIDALYVMASYTYGPLLGLFIFGLFTKWQVRDHLVPYIAIASPFICYLIQYLTSRFFGYQFGYELLMFNGLLTIIGLYCISFKKKDHGNTYG
jgi:Na+/proline symporter